jgi:hypothetical protein
LKHRGKGRRWRHTRGAKGLEAAKLTDEQRAVYELVSGWMYDDLPVELQPGEHAPDASVGRCAFVGAPGGAGKSVVLRLLRDLARALFGRERARGQHAPVVVCAHTGVAAANVGGYTTTSVFNDAQEHHQAEQGADGARGRAPGAAGRGGTAGRPSLVCMDQMLRGVTGVNAPFGNVIIVSFGDYYQCATVGTTPVFSDAHPRDAGRRLCVGNFVHYFEFTRLCRIEQGVAGARAAAVAEAFAGTPTHAHLATLKQRPAAAVDAQQLVADGALWLCPTIKQLKAVTEEAHRRGVAAGQVIHHVWARHTVNRGVRAPGAARSRSDEADADDDGAGGFSGGGGGVDDDSDARAGAGAGAAIDAATRQALLCQQTPFAQPGGGAGAGGRANHDKVLPPLVRLRIGGDVMLVRNVAVILGAFNGARGKVIDILYADWKAGDGARSDGLHGITAGIVDVAGADFASLLARG